MERQTGAVTPACLRQRKMGMDKILDVHKDRNWKAAPSAAAFRPTAMAASVRWPFGRDPGELMRCRRMAGGNTFGPPMADADNILKNVR